MRAVVTGGAGFLGSHLCDSLISMGYDVVCLDNLLTGNTDNIAHLLGNLGTGGMHDKIGGPVGSAQGGRGRGQQTGGQRGEKPEKRTEQILRFNAKGEPENEEFHPQIASAGGIRG